MLDWCSLCHSDRQALSTALFCRAVNYRQLILIRYDLTHSHTHTFNGPFSGTTRVVRYQRGKTNLDFTAARDSEWQWHQLGHMQVCTLLQTDNHTSTPPLSFLQAGVPSCLPTNSVKALKTYYYRYDHRHRIDKYSDTLPVR